MGENVTLKKTMKEFLKIFCIFILIFSTTSCTSRTKDISNDLQVTKETAIHTDSNQLSDEVATDEFSDEVLDETLDEAGTLTPAVDDIKNFKLEDISEGKLSSLRPEKVFTISPKNDETVTFNRFYYMDNMNHLNVFFWEKITDSSLNFTPCRLYKEEQDGIVNKTEINWNSDADIYINFPIMSQWVDEKNGDFYIIVSKGTINPDDSPSFLYGIHTNGELFVNLQLEDYLLMDKINPQIYTLGYTINYIGQDNGIVYLEYMDDSKKAVVYYDMNNKCFTKQIFTGYEVKGIIDGQYVGVSDQYLIIGSIPDGKNTVNAKGNTIAIGKSEMQHVYNLPKYKGISIRGKYVYMLTQKQYQRFIPGDDSWEMLADVSKITEKIKADLYMNDLIAKDKNTFSLLLYEDCGAGFYIDEYHVK